MFSTPRRRMFGWVLLSLVAAVVILGVVTVTIVQAQTLAAVRHTQLEGTPTGKKLVASADRILDCTDSTGECYQRNQRRSADVVADLNNYQLRVVVISSACAATLPSEGLTVRQRETRTLRCVTERLTELAD